MPSITFAALPKFYGDTNFRVGITENAFTHASLTVMKIKIVRNAWALSPNIFQRSNRPNHKNPIIQIRKKKKNYTSLFSSLDMMSYYRINHKTRFLEKKFHNNLVMLLQHNEKPPQQTDIWLMAVFFWFATWRTTCPSFKLMRRKLLRQRLWICQI